MHTYCILLHVLLVAAQRGADEYIPRNTVLLKTVCPNVHRAMADESLLRLASGSTQKRSCYARVN